MHKPKPGGAAYLQGLAVDDVKRVDYVAQRLGHLAALGVSDHAVEHHLQGTQRTQRKRGKCASFQCM